MGVGDCFAIARNDGTRFLLFGFLFLSLRGAGRRSNPINGSINVSEEILSLRPGSFAALEDDVKRGVGVEIASLTLAMA